MHFDPPIVPLFRRVAVPSVVRCCAVLLLLCFLIVGIHASGISTDPTDRLTLKLSEKLLTLKRSGHISEAFYNKIRHRHKQSPRIYGLPKIHKADTPLRPIASCVNTFAYDLSAFLANVLSPLAGNSSFTVKNSTDCRLLYKRGGISVRNKYRWHMFLLFSDYWWFGHETFSPIAQTLHNTALYWLRGGLNHTLGTDQYVLVSCRHWW